MNFFRTGRSSGLPFLTAFPYGYTNSGMEVKKFPPAAAGLYSYGDSAGFTPASLFHPRHGGEPIRRGKSREYMLAGGTLLRCVLCAVRFVPYAIRRVGIHIMKCFKSLSFLYTLSAQRTAHSAKLANLRQLQPYLCTSSWVVLSCAACFPLCAMRGFYLKLMIKVKRHVYSALLCYALCAVRGFF
jgi:hypothetical protein